LTISLLLASSWGWAQNFRYTYYSKINGLQSELTKAIALDTLGFLWLATDEGLFRFDGSRFNQYLDDLPSNYVKSLLLTREGGLLATTDMGLVRVDYRAGAPRFATLVEGGVQREDSARLWFPKQMFEDSRGQLWLTDNHAVYLRQGEGFRRFAFGPGNATEDYQRSFSFFEDGQGNFFAVSEPGNLFILRGPELAFEPVAGQPDFGRVDCAIRLEPGKVLVAASKGLFELRLASDGGILEQRVLAQGLDLSSMVLDHRGRLLLGSWTQGLFLGRFFDGGLLVEPLEAFQWGNVNNISLGGAGEIWVATDNGVALLQDKLFEHFAPGECSGFVYGFAAGPEGSMLMSVGERVFRRGAGDELELLLETPGRHTHALAWSEQGLWTGDGQGFVRLWKDGAMLAEHDFSGQGLEIVDLALDRQGGLWVCQNDGKGLAYRGPDGRWKRYGPAQGVPSECLVVRFGPDGRMWAGSKDGAYLLGYEPQSDSFRDQSLPFAFGSRQDIKVNDLDIDPSGTLWLSTNFGLLRVRQGELERVELAELTASEIKAFEQDENGFYWLATSQGLAKFAQGEALIFDDKNGLPSKIIHFKGIFIDSKRDIWLATLNGPARSSLLHLPRATPRPIFLQVEIGGKDYINEALPTDILSTDYLALAFVSASYPSQFLAYQYRMLGRDTLWRDLGNRGSLLLAKLEPGDYRLQIRAKQIGNHLWSQALEMPLEVRLPFYQTVWFWALNLILGVLFTWAMVRWRLRSVLRYQQELEAKVSARTHEVLVQKEELQAQHEEVVKQRDKIASQNHHIVASINYARRIQTAMLPSKTALNKVFPEHFVLYRPRDVVSGDFFWMAQVYDKVAVAVADCTGHGVPGAFMSMLGIAFLNEILGKNVQREGQLTLLAGEFLQQLRDNIKKALNQTGDQSENQDGMDMALVVFDLQQRKMQYAGAFNPALVFRAGGMRELKADAMPIGIYRKEKPKFTNHTLDLQEGDRVYLFSDGYLDQFGGPGERKFMAKRFRETLERAQALPMRDQHDHLEDELDRWRGANPQIDDILVMGLEVRFAGLRFESVKTNQWGKHTFLAVDDQEFNLITLQATLELETGCQVELCMNGQEALDRLERGPLPSLVLMDLDMPVMDGYAATRAIKARWPRLPVVVLTAQTDFTQKEKAFDAGCDDYITKPINAKEMLATIAKRLPS